MKCNYFLATISSFFFINGVVAQQLTAKQSEPQIIQTISVSKGQPQQVHDKAYYEQKIKEIDELLEAIEVKTLYVKSNEEEHKIATQNGWYSKMEQVKEESRKQRYEYEAVIKKMTK
jgi:hypothetical protein